MKNLKCPKCGSKETRKYLYGFPQRDYDSSNYILGGDILFESNPVYHCLNCEGDFGIMAGDVAGTNIPSNHNLSGLLFDLDKSEEIQIHIEIKEYKDQIRYKSIRYNPINKSKEEKSKKIEKSDWEIIRNRLVNEIFILDWPQRNDDRLIDTNWILDIFFSNGVEIKYSGYNDEFPYYDEFIDFIDEIGR
ncbi:MAG: hypothetical protein Q4P34_02480 [Tissierellia bacterium]|nr:hypothetical protein [Tissierellia bacterium]